MNFRSFYTIAIIIISLILVSPVTVSAYYLTLDAPAEVRVGEPVVVSGTTNVPPPDKIDIVLSRSINIPVEVTRKSWEINEKGETRFNVTFETTGLEKGNYKIEAISQTQRDFSAGSKNLRVIKLTDRSDIIRFSTPAFQDFENKLMIEARIQDYEDNAIQMEVKLGNISLFGPESVPVSRGLVKYELPIEEQGKYSIIFNDYKGYIGSYPVQVGEETAVPSTAVQTATSTITPSESHSPEQTVTVTSESTVSHTTIPTPEQTAAGSPAPTAELTARPAETKTDTKTVASGSGITRSAELSRDSPGYFLVTVNQVPVTISTSDNEDWVMEVKTSSTGAGVKVNDQMKAAAEKITISDDTKQIFLKVYPYGYKTSREVTLTVENAAEVLLSDDAAKAFGAPPRYGDQQPGSSGKSPAPVAALFAGLVGAALIMKRRL